MALHRVSFSRFAVAAVAVALGGGLTVEQASADDTGFAGIHDWRREGHHTCFSDHFHSGSGSAKPTREQATSDATNAWSGFTAAEYGSDWASFRNAASKTVSCDKSAGLYSCHVEARPCK